MKPDAAQSADTPRDVKNINTLAADLLNDMHRFEHLRTHLEIPEPGRFEDGFVRGVNALALRFIKAMDKGELDYERINRGR